MDNTTEHQMEILRKDRHISNLRDLLSEQSKHIQDLISDFSEVEAKNFQFEKEKMNLQEVNKNLTNALYAKRFI